MKKFVMYSWYYDQHCAVVEANNINEAFAEFLNYYGIPDTLDYSDIVNLTKDFTIEKFINYFECKTNYKVYGIYEIKETLFEKEL